MTYYLKCERPGILLSEALQKSDINFALPCSGKGTCGKCKLVVEKGQVSKISQSERAFLSNQEIKSGYRLACFTKIYSDIVLKFDDKANNILTKTLIDGNILKPAIRQDEYGISIDIGTTTVVINLFRGDSPNIMGRSSQINSQIKYGADIISRIDYSINHSCREIHNSIIEQLNKMIKALCREVSINNRSIKYAVITGNTTMLHFIENLDPRDIAFYPFKPKSLFGYNIDNYIGLAIAEEANIYIPPCVSAFVGADLVCSILTSGIKDKKENSLIIDIGTNGELAFIDSHGIKCCSTAAGPAFEGVGIEWGSSAEEGAIANVYYDDNIRKIKYTTINHKPAKSICGSGIIDAMSVLLKIGLIDDTGRILDKGHKFVENIIEINSQRAFKFDDCDIYITQKDIRQIQLAKGAIASGIKTLLMESKGDLEQIDNFYICGAFATYLNLSSAVDIGLVPPAIINKTIVLGNAALSGASAIILDIEKIEKCYDIAKRCDYIELSTNSFFTDEFIKSMSFKNIF